MLVLDNETTPENPKWAILEQLQLQIVITSPKHGEWQNRKTPNSIEDHDKMILCLANSVLYVPKFKVLQN